MKKKLILTFAIGIVLSACGGVKTSGANTPYAKETQAAGVQAAVPTYACPTEAQASGVQATVPDNQYARASQAIVEKWIATQNNRDAVAYLSLYSDDSTLRFCNKPTCDQYSLSDMRLIVPLDMATPGFKEEVQSYFLTKFGEWAVVQGLYSDPNIPVTNVPAISILEIKDGKIVSETDYWTEP